MGKEKEYDPVTMVTVVSSILILTVLGMGYFFYTLTRDEDLRDQQARRTCTDLNLKYEDKVTVKEGFYRDLTLNVVSVGLYTITGLEITGRTEITVRCDQVTRSLK